MSFIDLSDVWGSRPLNTPSQFRRGITSPKGGVYEVRYIHHLGEQ